MSVSNHKLAYTALHFSQNHKYMTVKPARRRYL